MNNLKKTALAILVLSSSTAFAGTMGPVCTEGNVTTPCEHPAWDIGGQALYLQTTTAGNFYLNNNVNTAGITNWNRVTPNWNWGFQLEASYHFDTGNDFDVNWYHYNSTTNRSYTGVTTAASGPFNLQTRLSPTWNAVNLEFGQRVNFGDHKNIRLHGGAQFVQVSNNFLLIPAARSRINNEQFNLRYNGFGPRGGADLFYTWGYGFTTYAKAAAAVFVGPSKFNIVTSGIEDSPGVSRGKSNILVPELEGKLGVKYTYAMPQGDLSLDAGYMWVDYIGAQSVVSAFSALNGSSDFGVNGVYFGLKWIGSV